MAHVSFIVDAFGTYGEFVVAANMKTDMVLDATGGQVGH